MNHSHHSTADSHPAGLLGGQGRTRTALLFLALGMLVAKTCTRCAAVRRQRVSEQTARKPAPLQRWEGEGGTNEPPVGGDITD